MFQDSFEDLCDQLWCDWLHEEISDSEFGGLNFDKDSAPEPWLELRSGANPLVVVTTNPGGSMDIQRHAVIKRGDSPIILPKQTYASSTVGLGHYYEANLPKGSAAERRIKSMVQLATLAGYDGLYQVEACPFHSTSFPDKKKFVGLLEKNAENIMSRYPVCQASDEPLIYEITLISGRTDWSKTDAKTHYSDFEPSHAGSLSGKAYAPNV